MADGPPERALAPVFVGEGRIEFREKPVPAPGRGQLLVEVRANAVCASDMGQYRGGSAVTPGHEAAGVVAGAGEGTSVPVGTPGVVFLMDFCGECRSCRLGATNQCLAKRADYGFSHDGGYGAYELVNENVFFPTAPGIPFAEATLLLDVVGTSSHAVRRAMQVRPDVDSLLVTGAGPIGLGVIAMARAVIGRDLRVFATDLVPYRLELARRLGAVAVNVGNAGEKPLRAALARHDAVGVDVAIDATGRAAARREALDALGKRGVLVCVGHGEGLALDVSADLIAPERAVLGSEYFRFDELEENQRLFLADRERVSRIVTHRFPVSEIGRAFEAFRGGETGKVVVER